MFTESISPASYSLTFSASSSAFFPLLQGTPIRMIFKKSKAKPPKLNPDNKAKPTRKPQQQQQHQQTKL